MADWILWLLIVAHIHTPIAGDYTRDQFVLTQPFEYGITQEGVCYEYAPGTYPGPSQAWASILHIPAAIANPNTVLYEDGSCVTLPGPSVP